MATLQVLCIILLDELPEMLGRLYDLNLEVATGRAVVFFLCGTNELWMCALFCHS